jgi:heterodisulfide reductase subunit A2
MANKHIIIIGGGICGMEAAIASATLGYHVSLIEREHKLGGNVANWDRLFPNFNQAPELISSLMARMAKVKINLYLNTIIANVNTLTNHTYQIELKDGNTLTADAILITTGFSLFNAERKEEFGYGIYDNVITSADLEEIFRLKKEITTSTGNTPKRIAFVHCVGSRDEKAGNIYCSKVCCITGVKQAIEIKQQLPNVEIICFYIDLRMYGHHFEELYREAQEKWGVQFIRGRISEASENIDNTIQLKAEDTLSGRPIKMIVDMMVLLSGMEPSSGRKSFIQSLHLPLADNNFIKTLDEHTNRNLTEKQGVFIAGAATGPVTITETIQDARAAAYKIHEFFTTINQTTTV